MDVAATATSSTDDAWLPYDMERLSSIESTWQAQLSTAAAPIETATTTMELVQPDERDFLAMYDAFNIPAPSPGSLQALINQPYEERYAPGKATRIRTVVHKGASPREPAEQMEMRAAGFDARDDLTNVLRETQQRLTASKAHVAAMQRQISQSLAMLRDMTAERDNYRAQFQRSQELLAICQEELSRFQSTPPLVPPPRSSSTPNTNTSSPMDNITVPTDLAPRATPSLLPRTTGGDFKLSGAEEQHEKYDHLAELAARANTTDQEYTDAVQQYWEASVRQNFITRDEVDQICTPRFFMRNLAINFFTAPDYEQNTAADTLQRWAQVMKGSGASQAQFEQTLELIYATRRECQIIYEERHGIITELMQFFQNKLPYFLRLYLGEEGTDIPGLIRAVKLIASLRANLNRFIDVGIETHRRCAAIFSPRQLALIYLQNHRHIVTTTDALVAVTALT